MMRALALGIVAVVGCGGGQAATKKPAAVRCDRSLLITTAEQAAAAGACRQITGDLVIRGAIITLAPLAKLEKVTGELRIAGAFSLDPVSGLAALREVGGNLVVGGNPVATGVYFPALVRVGGNATVRGNAAALTVSLHKLVRVGGSLTIGGNDGMLRLDLSALRHVGGTFSVHGNAKLDTFAVDPAIRQRVQTKKPR